MWLVAENVCWSFDFWNLVRTKGKADKIDSIVSWYCVYCVLSSKPTIYNGFCGKCELIWNFMVMNGRQNLQVFKSGIVYFWSSTCTAPENKSNKTTLQSSGSRRQKRMRERERCTRNKPRFSITNTTPINPTMFHCVFGERISIDLQLLFLTKHTIINDVAVSVCKFHCNKTKT